MADFTWTSFTVGQVFSEASAVIKRNLLLCAVGALLLFAIRAGGDLGARQWLPAGSKLAPFTGWIILPVIAVAQYLIVAQLMRAERLAERGWSPVALLSYISADLLILIGTIAGSIALLIPGIILALRWTIAGNFVIGRDLGPVDAIKASWTATRGSAGTIFIVLLVLTLATAAGIILLRGGFVLNAAVSPAIVVISSLYAGLAGMVSMCVTTAMYAMLAGRDHTHLTEVFA